MFSKGRSQQPHGIDADQVIFRSMLGLAFGTVSVWTCFLQSQLCLLDARQGIFDSSRAAARRGLLRPAALLSDAKHRTRSVTRYRVAKIPQAARRAGLRTSSDHDHIRTQSARRVGQHVFNRADGDADQSVRAGGGLQLLNPAARGFSFRRLQSLLQIQSDPQVGRAPGNHVARA